MRKFVNFGLVLCAALVVGSPASGFADTGRADDAERATQQAKNKRVCKRVKVTGTHFARRICQSQAEWDAMRRQDKEDMDRVMTRNPHDIPVDGGAAPF